MLLCLWPFIFKFGLLHPCEGGTLYIAIYLFFFTIILYFFFSFDHLNFLLDYLLVLFCNILAFLTFILSLSIWRTSSIVFQNIPSMWRVILVMVIIQEIFKNQRRKQGIFFFFVNDISKTIFFHLKPKLAYVYEC